MSEVSFDLAIVGAGIVGLAHALAGARLGKRVVVIDRDTQANGASVRNFGFITVSGQASGAVWRMARRTRDVWAEVAGAAGIAVEQNGLALVARRPEARAVAEAFLGTEMAGGCAWLEADEARATFPALAGKFEGVMTSDIDLRVESRTAIPRLAAWLEQAHGVVFRRGVVVHGVNGDRLETSAGAIRAEAVVVCPGDDLTTLFPDRLTGITRCKLQMMRLAAPGWRLPAAVMSDLGMIRYLGYADLPAAAALRARLQAEQPEHLAHGVHLIVAQSADGSLVVGDSHHYAATPDPFSHTFVDDLILDEFAAVFGQAAPPVLERWTGVYASGPDHSVVEAPAPNVRLVTVTCGAGASTGFALAEEVVGDLYGIKLGAAA